MHFYIFLNLFYVINVMFYSSLCCHWLCLFVCSTAVCTPEGVWPGAACASPGNTTLCCARRCSMTYSSFCCTWTVLLHLHCEPVPHLDVSRAFSAPRVSFYKSLRLCVLSKRAYAAPVSVCPQELWAAPVRVNSLYTRALCCTYRRVCLQKPRPILYLCRYKI